MTLIAVDIGNARIKLGCFVAACADRPGEALPEPECVLSLSSDAARWDEVAQWLDVAEEGLSWWIGSVNRPAASRLLDWLRAQRPRDRATLLAAGDLPLRVAVPRPDMVGVDRLLDAVAANRLRDPVRPAVVVDAGTAITVDAVSADGAFLGGAILPGIGMAARALHEFTDLLPLIDVEQVSSLLGKDAGEAISDRGADLPVGPETQQNLRPASEERRVGCLPHGASGAPPAVGRDTEAAMRSGLFWGAVGAIRELTARVADDAGAPPQVFLTGGAGSVVAGLLGPDARQVPHLTLAGIALTARAAT